MFVWSDTWIVDVWTVLRKEARELTAALVACPLTLAAFLFSALILSALLVWSAATTGNNSVIMLVVWLLAPVLPTSVAVAESIAGEREHRTFESLLMTPLSPFALLVGKVSVATLFGWMATVTALVIASGVANLLGTSSPVAEVAGPYVGAMLALSLLSAALTASAGSCAVAHVATVRQAYVRLAWVVAIVATGVALVLLLVGGWMMQSPAASEIATDAASTRLALVGIVLLVTDTALYTIAALHFRRKQLLAD